MKKIIRMIYVFLLLITINLNTVYATPIYKDVEIKTTPIQIMANVPEKFDKTIYVNFILEDGTNNNYVLTYQNNYKCNDIIKVGNAKLNFVNIVNNNNQYSYYCTNILVAEEGKNINFQIDINENENNEENKINEELKSDENIEKETDEIKEINPTEDNKIKKNTKANSIKSLLIDAVMVILLIIIYLIIKNKKIKGEM
ncbi:UNVERIFIED_ORG: hypothetical protein B2H98_08200 [Clostridium botulinum]